MADELSAELDPGLIRRRRQMLLRLATKTASPELADMAKDLLARRITPREIMESEIYDEALNIPMQEFASWYSSASEEELDEAVRNGEIRLEQLAQEELNGVPDQPVAETHPARPARRADDDDLPDRSWLV